MREDPAIKILVTGADGQLGKSIQYLSRNFPQFNFYFTGKSHLDITNFRQISKVFGDFRPEFCINTAAYTAVDASEKNPTTAYEVNAEGAGMVASMCNKLDTFLIHISTDYVYNSKSGQVIAENEPANPQSLYGKSKLEGEHRVRRHCQTAVILRTSWLYSEYGKNFVKTMLKLGKQRDKITVVDDQIGSPTYAIDLAEALLSLVSKISDSADKYSKHETYNYCNSGRVSWYEFARYIFDISGIPCKVLPVSTEEYNAPAPRPKWSVLSTKKIKNEFQLEIPSWQSSLKQCLRKLNN